MEGGPEWAGSTAARGAGAAAVATKASVGRLVGAAASGKDSWAAATLGARGGGGRRGETGRRVAAGTAAGLTETAAAAAAAAAA